MLTPTVATAPDAVETIRALLDTTPDGVVMFDCHGRIECCNRTAERYFDYEEREVIGRNIGALMAISDGAARDSETTRHQPALIPTLPGTRRDAVARRRDGTSFPVFLSVGRIGATNPPRFVTFIQDATALDQARRAQDRLGHVARLAMLGEMVSGIAHELNQPLAAITAYAQASQRLLSGDVEGRTDVVEALDQIAAQALRAGDIILRLRDLARGSPSRRVPCDLNDVVRDLMPLVNADARHHDVRIVLDLAHERLVAEQDPEQVQQVLLNLLHNAIEALAEEPAQAREIIISTSRGNGGQVQLDVCDNGPGVDPRIAAQMFHPFCTTKPAGTGLGLAISHSIARAHGGHLEYIPGSTRGARFRLSLPWSSGES